MSDRSLTLLEIHLGDGDIDIGPLGVLGEAGSDGNDEVAAASDDASGSDGDAGGCVAKRIGGLLLALGALAVVAVGVAKLLGDDE